MDCGSDFIKEFKLWISTMDEDYLTGISNKGIYNRAVKDLDGAGNLDVSGAASELVCTLPDGNKCTLVSDIKKCKCTCPSRTVCKHIVMGLLFVKQNSAVIFGIEEDTEAPIPEAAASDDFSRILGIKPGMLKKLAGERVYDSILFRLNYQMKVEFEEGRMLAVQFTDEGVTVRFLPDKPIEDALCTCKSKELCRHKLEAVVHYQIFKGAVKQEDLYEEEKLEISDGILKDVKEFIKDILTGGLARLPETSVENMEQNALICHNAGLANLEKLFRRLGSQASLYFNKDVRFSRESMRNMAALIYNLCQAMQKGKCTAAVQKKLTGELKSSYYDIPELEIHGLGAEGWSSASGYEGLTFYFYCTKLCNWFTYTISRPAYYEENSPNAARMYKASPPWGIEGTLESFSKSLIKLVNGKINKENRLSSSEESAGTVIKRSSLEEAGLNGQIYDDWSLVLDKVSDDPFSSFLSDENHNLLVLKIKSWGTGSYDNTKQEYVQPIYDAAGKSIDIKVKYIDRSKQLIEKLEKLTLVNALPDMLLCRVYMEDERPTVFPIAGYYDDGRIHNLTLD